MVLWLSRLEIDHRTLNTANFRLGLNQKSPEAKFPGYTTAFLKIP